MKRLIVLAAMLMCLMKVSSQTQVIRQGNNFTTVTKSVVKEDKKTEFTWTDSKGNVYPIYVSKTGSCYVKKVSKKSGKEYKQYLGPEISSQVCKELGIKYEPKNKK